MTPGSFRRPRAASLGSFLSLAWLLVTASRVFIELRAQRYVELGYRHLASVAVRDVTLDALPFLVPGVPAAILALRLARRPRPLAALVPTLLFLSIFAAGFEALNDAVRTHLAERLPRAAVLCALALVPAALGLTFAAWVGRVGALRSAFVTASDRLGVVARELRAHPFMRLLSPPWLTAGVIGVVAVAVVLPIAMQRNRAGGTPIVLIVVDTLRADHLGTYGYSRNTSPNLDRWASNATVFERGIAQASWTKPSVASLFTSLHPSVHRTGSGTARRRRVDAGRLELVPAPDDAPRTSGTLAPELLTLAEVLREGGYVTAAYVANGLLGAGDGYPQGFAEYRILDDRRLTRAGVRFVAEHANDRFFLYLHYMSPHAPYEPPAAFDRFGSAESRSGARFSLRRTATKDSVNFMRTLVPTAEEVTALVDRYDGEIAFVDELIESVFGAIAENGLSDHAVVVVTADHGEEFMDHGMLWHESIHLYEELVRVPFIWRAPGLVALSRPSTRIPAVPPRRVSEPVMHVDVAPTIIELAGLSAPEEMQGRSLVGLLAGRTPPPRNAYSETLDWGEMQATWSERDKLIVDRERASLELYDLEADPAERIDLSASRPEARAALLDSVNAMRAANRARRGLLDVEIGELTAEQRERLRSLGYLD